VVWRACDPLYIVNRMDAASPDPVAIVTMDHKGRLVDLNAEAERFFGFNRTEVINRMLAEIMVPPRLRMQHAAGLARYLSSGQGPVLGKSIEVPALNAKGDEVPVGLLIRRVENSDPPLFEAELRPVSKA
jgi:PAS domain S-box-containing protein